MLFSKSFIDRVRYPVINELNLYMLCRHSCTVHDKCGICWILLDIGLVCKHLDNSYSPGRWLFIYHEL